MVQRILDGMLYQTLKLKLLELEDQSLQNILDYIATYLARVLMCQPSSVNFVCPTPYRS